MNWRPRRDCCCGARGPADWLLPEPGSAATSRQRKTGDNARVPESVMRYARRMRGALVDGGATRERPLRPRPLLHRYGMMLVLAVPILSRGILRAVRCARERNHPPAAFTASGGCVNAHRGQLASTPTDKAVVRRAPTTSARGSSPQPDQDGTPPDRAGPPHGPAPSSAWSPSACSCARRQGPTVVPPEFDAQLGRA